MTATVRGLGAVLCVVLGAWGAACAEGDIGAAPLSTVIDTVGDTVVARTSGEVPAESLRTLTVEWRAGEGDDPATSFASISSIAVGPDGSVLVWDFRARTLRLYGAGGELVRTVGRAGSGPGEHDRLNGVAICPDGKLLAWDSGNSRINVYAADGTPQTSWKPRGCACHRRARWWIQCWLRATSGGQGCVCASGQCSIHLRTALWAFGRGRRAFERRADLGPEQDVCRQCADQWASAPDRTRLASGAGASRRTVEGQGRSHLGTAHDRSVMAVDRARRPG